MNFFYEVLADFIVTIHLGYMAYVLLGQLVILIGWGMHWNWVRNPWFRVTHLAMILIVAFEAVIGFECPLTTWERDLRVHIGQIPANHQELDDWDVENASFIANLMRKVMFPEADIVPYLKPSYYTFAGIVLATAILLPPRFRRRPEPAAPLPESAPTA